MSAEVAVLLYPGCVFFEIALAVEVVGSRLAVGYYTPDGSVHEGLNGARLQAAGSYADLAGARPVAVLVPGGDPGRILEPRNLAGPSLQVHASAGALVAGICAGNLVMAASGLLDGRRGTHNYTREFATPAHVRATEAFWAGMTYERADIVRDGNLVTAQPWAYRQYATAVAEALGVLDRAAAADLERYVRQRTIGAP